MHRLMRFLLTAALCVSLWPVPEATQRGGSGQVTVLYFVRHGEVDPTDRVFPLSSAGKLRALAFADTVRGIAFTHVFSSHTTRARQTVEPVARELNLAVQQRPEPGTRLNGSVVSDDTPARTAITPLLQSLRSLPRGSSVLVGVNSDNLYAILHGLGVPVATSDRPCAKGSTCVPCLTNACFPGGYDQLWILMLDHDGGVATLIELRNAAGGAP